MVCADCGFPGGVSDLAPPGRSRFVGYGLVVEDCVWVGRCRPPQQEVHGRGVRAGRDIIATYIKTELRESLDYRRLTTREIIVLQRPDVGMLVSVGGAVDGF